MKLLVQNTKMKKSSINGMTVVNWTIPAFMSSTGLKTCPNAGMCAGGCYARSGTYAFGNVKSAHEAKLALTQLDSFSSEMIAEIDTWLKKKSVKHLKIRIHDAGDFYSAEYLNKWLSIMTHFIKDSRVSFYAYTKQVAMFKQFKALLLIPNTFTVIYSFGGKQDASINAETDRHARVFESLDELQAAGYSDGTENDLVAASGTSNKIGLVYHGAKNYTNTAWNKVLKPVSGLTQDSMAEAYKTNPELFN
jgi:hypothetical protein